MDYMNHEFVLSSEYDSAFRIIGSDAECIDETQGGVDEPSGHLTMVTIDGENIEHVSSALGEAGEPVPSEGFYIVHEDSLGIIVVFGYRNERERARDWNVAAAEIEEWSSREEA